MNFIKLNFKNVFWACDIFGLGTTESHGVCKALCTQHSWNLSMKNWPLQIRDPLLDLKKNPICHTNVDPHRQNITIKLTCTAKHALSLNLLAALSRDWHLKVLYCWCVCLCVCIFTYKKKYIWHIVCDSLQHLCLCVWKCVLWFYSSINPSDAELVQHMRNTVTLLNCMCAQASATTICLCVCVCI